MSGPNLDVSQANIPSKQAEDQRQPSVATMNLEIPNTSLSESLPGVEINAHQETADQSAIIPASTPPADTNATAALPNQATLTDNVSQLQQQVPPLTAPMQSAAAAPVIHQQNIGLVTATPITQPQQSGLAGVTATAAPTVAQTVLPQQQQQPTTAMLQNQNAVLQYVLLQQQQQQQLQQGLVQSLATTATPATAGQTQARAQPGSMMMFTPQQIQQYYIPYLQQQQLLAANASYSVNTPSNSLTTLAAMQAGGLHPAKRQAVAVPLTNVGMLQQYLQNRALQMCNSYFSSIGQTVQINSPQFMEAYNKCYREAQAQVANAGLFGMGSQGMRVAINKRDRTAGDRLFLAVDNTSKNHADEIFERCQELSKTIKARLGKGFKGNGADGRFGGTSISDAAQAYNQVSQEKLMEVCGDTARYLKPYQVVGVNFLMLLFDCKIGGAILADEMGLGKTAQLITYLGAIRELSNDPGPHLVVVPASLLENWQRELRRWCPKIKSVVYYGKHRVVVRKRLNDLRERMQKGEQVDDDLADLQDADVLAEAAASERVAMATAQHEEADKDPLGLSIMHESDDEYDERRDIATRSGTVLPVEPPGPKYEFDDPVQPAPFDVLLTSYTLFERDSTDQRDDRMFLESWRWSHLIMDEAHALKNKDALRTTRLRNVANCSRRRIMMTGTPLQNDLMELHNLMNFLLPKLFEQGNRELQHFEMLLQGDEREVRRLTERMKELLGPFVLRRLKSEVAGQLTEKKRTTKFIEMSPEQSAMYETSLTSMRSEITGKVAAAVSDQTDGGVEKFMKSLGAKKVNHMFTHLRKIAQHPLLIRHHYDDETVKEIAQKALQMELFSGNVNLRRITEELLGYSDYSLHAFCYNSGPEFMPFRLTREHLMTSTKFRFLADLLPKLKQKNSRPLIFSQWTAVLDVIEWLMEELRLPYVRLDGSTAVDERLATVDRFNTRDDVFAFLLSTRAGGQGLNLTGADTVILHDVDFNPQIDRQAEDRCHRLGQTKPVMVYRLITKATVDQNIYKLSQRKLKLDHAVMEGITSGKGGRGARLRENAQQRQQMSMIMHGVLGGNEDYEELLMAGDEIEEQEGGKDDEVKKEDGKMEEKVEGEGKKVEGEGKKVEGEGKEEEQVHDNADMKVETAENHEEKKENGFLDVNAAAKAKIQTSADTIIVEMNGDGGDAMDHDVIATAAPLDSVKGADT